MAGRKSSNHGKRFIACKSVRVAALCCVVGLAIAGAGCESESDRKARETAALQAKFSEQLKAENAATARLLEESARANREATSVRVAVGRRAAHPRSGVTFKTFSTACVSRRASIAGG
jgi:hypothetical protein